MNFLNRAWKNITRGKTKTFLLILTFFLIGNLVIVGLGITSAAENAKKKARQSMNPVVNVTTDYSKWYDYVDNLEEEERDKIYENWRETFPYITEEMILELMKDERIKAVNALTVNTLYADGFEAVPLNNERENNEEYNGQSCWMDEFGNEECYTYESPSVAVKSNMFDSMIEMELGTFSLVEGRFYTQEDIDNANKVCLITEELAEYNNLRVGDTISLKFISKNDLERMEGFVSEEDVIAEFEIIGIYHTNNIVDENSDGFDWMDKYESPYNLVLTPTPGFVDAQIEYYKASSRYYSQMYGNGEEVEEQEYNRDDYMTISSATIMLTDPLDVEGFIEDHKDSLGEYRKFESDNTTFQQMARPLDTLSLFANIIVWIVIVNAVVIITLITALTLKNREYEIGVMLSIGVTKAKIVLQFFVELIIVAVLGFTLAVVSGSLIAGKVGDMVMDYQIATEDKYAEESDDNNYYYGTDLWNTNYFTDITQEEIIEQYEVSISPLIIAEIYILGLGVVFISILIPSAMIMRFNPKKILMSTN